MGGYREATGRPLGGYSGNGRSWETETLGGYLEATGRLFWERAFLGNRDTGMLLGGYWAATLGTGVPGKPR